MATAGDTECLPPHQIEDNPRPAIVPPDPYAGVPSPLPDPRGGKRPRRWWRWIRTILLTIVLLIPALLLLIASAVIWQARTNEARPADAIVVLGAAQYNGRPSNVLSSRLDQAYDLYARGLAPRIIVTGGMAEGDIYTEAESGAMYLQELGVPDSAILMESEGTDTWESMQGVDTLLEGTNVQTLLVVSDGFHLLRAELMARALGYQAYSSPATDSPIEPWSGLEIAHVIRETGGIVVLLPTLLEGLG